jgi:dTDP-4-dehydrorhamnose reductase
MSMAGARRVLVLGPTGQVGGELLSLLGPGALGVGRDEADLLKPETLREVVARHQPTIVVNAAADTAVDRAETEIETARSANAIGPATLATGCAEAGARLIHFSTDYVFDGTKGEPYEETDATCPINAYGQTKLEGEQAVLAADPRHVVIRLSWVYSTRGRNFALTMLRLAREGRPIRVVSDQIGSPTYARYIAEGAAAVIQNLMEQPATEGGLFHLTAAGSTSWAGFAQALLDEALGESAPNVEPIPTTSFPTPAKRPAYSVLSNEKVAHRFGVRLAPWEDQVARWAANIASPGERGL